MKISHVYSQAIIDSQKQGKLLTQKSTWQGHSVCRGAVGNNPIITLPLIGICLGIAGVSLVAGITFRAALLGAAVAVALPVALIVFLSVIGRAAK